MVRRFAILAPDESKARDLVHGGLRIYGPTVSRARGRWEVVVLAQDGDRDAIEGMVGAWLRRHNLPETIIETNDLATILVARSGASEEPASPTSLVETVGALSAPLAFGGERLEEMLDRLRVAAKALSVGDPRPFASLFAVDAEWRGVAEGVLWWKRVPA
jgi:hypothetical protein